MAKIQKRLILICAAVLMLVTLLLLAVTASAAAWDGTIASGFAGGSGSSADPYRISNGAELAYLADRVNGGEDFQGKYIALTADIDLGNVNWTPIGTYTNPFRGNFSGNVNDGTNKPVCTISNLKISGTEDYQGLFGVSTGYIRVVQIENADISGNYFVGGICGQNTGDIVASYVKNSTIKGNSDVGGICGANYGVIKNSINYNNSAASSVTGDTAVGGICGTDYNEITGCVNYSSVKGSDTVGGICGKVKTAPPSTPSSTPSTPVISNCANKGVVSLKNDGYYLGGICGYISSGEISNCLNSGEVSTVGTDTDDGQGGFYGASYIGGICGNAEETSIEYTINVGKISRDTFTDVFGNIFGDKTDSSINNCYYGSEINEDIPASSEGIPTSKLCTVSKLGFDMSVWEDGEISYESVDTDGFMTVRYLISGNSGGRPNVNLVNIFNFGTDSEPNWKLAKKVANRSELEAIKNDMGKNYVLVNDIDLSGSEWTPIGNYFTAFRGMFDGNGKVISNLLINTNDYDRGLFGGSIGTIQNLTLTNCDINGGESCGGIAGNNFGTIKNCFVTGNIIGTKIVGGICGYNSSENDGNVNGTTIDCVFIGTVSGTVSYGPIYGQGTAPKNCFYNSDLCSTNNPLSGRGLTTLQLTSSDVLETLDFNTEIWAKKANDKDNLIAYYPNLKKNGDPISIKYETKTKFAHHTTENGFNISTLVKFDGMADFEPSNASNVACAGSYTITDGADVTITGKMYDNTEIYVPIDSDTHKCVFTFKYDGTNSSFISDFDGEWGEHDYSTKWSSDETAHWKECLKCGDKKDTEAHTFDSWKITDPATETSDGKKEHSCTVCGYTEEAAVKYEKTDAENAAEAAKKALDELKVTNDTTAEDIINCIKKVIDDDVTAEVTEIKKVPATEDNEGSITVVIKITDSDGNTETIKKTFVIGKLPKTADDDNDKPVYYPIFVSGNVTADRTSAQAGETVNVSTAFGYDIIVTANGRQTARITEKGSFVMPNCRVYITVVQNDTLAAMSNAWNHSYVYSYDSDMNRIRISSDSKRGTVTIKLGSEYAGREFTIYKGRNSTKVKVTEGILDENGAYSFKADEGRNYTLVIK